MAKASFEDLDLEILSPGESGLTFNLATEEDVAKRSASKALRDTQRLEEEEPAGRSGKQSVKMQSEGDELMGEIVSRKEKEKVKVKNAVFDEYNVMLNLTDISYGQKGHNKYYQIQIQKKGSKFGLFTKWGRVGAKNPQSNLQEFDSRIDAIQEFKRKFREKTMNDWDEKDSFRPKPGKYTMINVDAGAASGESLNEEISKLNKRNDMIKKRIKENKSNLEESLRSFMEMIWDINRMNRTLRELNFDTEKHPLGKLSAEQINKGYRILTEIQNALASRSNTKTLINLSNEFYTNIPQNYGMNKPPMIDHILKLKEKLQMLDVLKELEIASKYIRLSLFMKSEDVNPLDSFYELLNVKMQKLTPEIDSNSYALIRNALANSHGPTHKFSLTIKDIFEVKRKGEAEKFYPFQGLPNQMLLWHGSRVTNFAGILSEGLRIAPPEAPVTGYMFGKGVYFADVSSKSANYCRATPENPEGLLILCEVAMGNMYTVHKAKPLKKAPKYHHSVFAEGKFVPEPNDKVHVKDGVYIHSGKIIENQTLITKAVQSDLNYNEYVIYDTSQVKIKYILRVRFNF